MCISSMCTRRRKNLFKFFCYYFIYFNNLKWSHRLSWLCWSTQQKKNSRPTQHHYKRLTLSSIKSSIYIQGSTIIQQKILNDVTEENIQKQIIHYIGESKRKYVWRYKYCRDMTYIILHFTDRYILWQKTNNKLRFWIENAS